MKRILTAVMVLALFSPVLAQEEKPQAQAEEPMAAPSAAGVDTLDDLWMFQDATPTDEGKVDLRFSFGWQTGARPGGTGDTFQVTPALYWGVAENFELSANMPAWVGDGGDRYIFDEGNYDTYLGVLWKVSSQEDNGHADFALAGNFRIPTGDGSNGVDYEARLAVTRTYDNGIRSHFNLWGKVPNGDNNKKLSEDLSDNTLLNIAEEYDDERDFQYGATVGVDYPLCMEGAVRLILDYTFRNSILEGQTNWHIAEIGWEWQMTDADKLGMSFQFSLDRAAGAPNAGAAVTYAHALTF